MLDKSDSNLGELVHQHLVKMGVETPISINITNKIQAMETISNCYRTIMDTLGLDLDDDSLMDTPDRVAKMYVNEIFSGLDYNNFPKCKLFQVKHDEMITVNNIKVMSVCEHHIQNITGYAYVAYIPQNGCIGLSKINRIVDFFARRPQVQERLTEQVFYALSYILETDNVAVAIKADHFCVKARGIGDMNSYTRTTKLGGCFKNQQDVKQEFYSNINQTKFRCD